MNAVDATSRSVEADTGAPSSLLTVILDTNPHAWNLISPSLPLHKALASLLVFLNAHLAINPANSVAVLASHVERAEWLYPTPPKNTSSHTNGDVDMTNGGPVQPPPDDANKYRPFAAIERAITTNLQTLLATTTPTSLTSTPTTMTAGALTLALTHTSKATTAGPTSTQTAQSSFNYSDPNSNTSDSRATNTGGSGTSTSRILILSTSPDNSAQYIPTMNAIFAAQRLSIPIDVLTLASTSTFLQQAADATGGIHLSATTPPSHAGLLQTLMLAFLPDPTARQNLILPSQASGSAGAGVDFRAACFCHRRIVDVGFVCSICLSIFCEPVPDGTCLTCGSHLALGSFGRKPAVVARKKKKRKRVVEGGNGVETPGSAGGTPVPA